jgi:hypothetical protein
VRHIYNETENQVFLNAYTYIQLEIFAELRLDKFQQSVNEVGGVQIKDYNSTNDKVAFNIDRISLSQITDIVGEIRTKNWSRYILRHATGHV